MKHFIRDTFVFVVNLFGVSFLYRFILRKKGPLVRVICFHDVADRKWFEKIVAMLVEEYHIITPAEFKAQAFDEAKINILLTFDDGYQTWIDTCLPLLEKFQLKGIFFVNSGLLDSAHNEQKVAEFFKSRVLISQKKPLTWDGAKMLVRAGHTIGGHTINHVNLASFEREQAYTEIYEDKKRHEEMLGVSLKEFAFPFGTKKHFTQHTIEEAVNSGYDMCFSAITGFYHPTTKLALVPRTLLENNQSPVSVKSWIEGGFDCFYKIKNCMGFE
jgi:peptidoglycan/xylan/chitin deacetylase (PgdA/CDA1 family)